MHPKPNHVRLGGMNQVPALVVDGVTKSFGERVVVRSFDLTVMPGEVVSLIGPNGAGKTTLIKMITGQYRADRGSIFVGQHALATEPMLAKAQIGYVPDEPWVYPYLTGREFLGFTGGLYGLDEGQVKKQVMRVKALFHLAESLDEPMHSYSRGTKQKVMVMAALMHRPKLLVFDEPIVGLDWFSQEAWLNLVKSFQNEGGAVLLATHSLDIAQLVSSRVAVMDSGKLVADGPLAQLAHQAKLKKVSLKSIFSQLTAL